MRVLAALYLVGYLAMVVSGLSKSPFCKTKTRNEINWQQGDGAMWSHDCDFPENDMGNEEVSGEECGGRCRATQDCTHFAWFQGVCYKKSGEVNKDAAITKEGVVCGYLTDGGTTEERNGRKKAPPKPGNGLKKGKLIFSNDFNSISDVNNNWNQEVGGNGWGNNELQFYTNGNKNVKVANGNLQIITRKERKENRDYTSARLKSKRTFRYGVFEFRARLPRGKGTWPAIWLLAGPKANWKWPDDGEIDIMEHVGYDMNNIISTIHCAAYNHMKGTQKSNAIRLSDVVNTWHTYQLEWKPNSIRMLVDNKQIFKYDKPPNAGYDKWPFNNQMNIILNTAFGGNWGGAKGIDNSVLPQTFYIDFVKVYELAKN